MPEDVGGNGVPIMNCENSVTKHYKSATFTFQP